MKEMRISRRRFLQLSAGLGMLTGLGRLQTADAANDYKALVCIFMFGGNDGHNMVVPLDSAQYTAYKNARQSLTLAVNQLLPINDASQGAFGFHFSMPELQALYNQGHVAVLANVGMLVKPTLYANQSQSNFPLPLQLRSHADQVVQMQTGQPDASMNTGWGGRCVDTMQANYNYNAGTSFPTSISMEAPALFCSGNVVQGTMLQPGNFMSQPAMGLYPPSAAQARQNAQNQVITAPSGNTLVDAANKSLATAVSLNPILAQAANSISFNKAFPGTDLGNQLKEIARLISLNATLGVGRQVFFASISAFDTHGGQSWQQQDNLQQVSQAMDAFYAATVQLGVANR